MRENKIAMPVYLAWRLEQLAERIIPGFQTVKSIV
jgi:hypothetical protein